MKPLFPVIPGLLFFIACIPSHDKPSTPTDQPVVISQLDSMTEWNNTDKGFFKQIFGFTYDAQGRLVKMAGTVGDSGGDGTPQPIHNVVITFGYSGLDSIPSFYSSVSHGEAAAEEPPVDHQLYLSDGQLIADTFHMPIVFPASIFTEVANFHYYPDKIFRITSYYDREDTIYYSKGNMIADSSMGVVDNGQGPVRYGVYWQTWQYGAEQNPLYIPAFAKIGITLFMNLYFDFGSVNTVSSYRFLDESRKLVTWNYTWTKDAQGRVIGGNGLDATDGSIQDQVLYSYKK